MIPMNQTDEVLEVMPWPFFRNMTTSDLRAIPHAEHGTCKWTRTVDLDHGSMEITEYMEIYFLFLFSVLSLYSVFP